MQYGAVIACPPPELPEIPDYAICEPGDYVCVLMNILEYVVECGNQSMDNRRLARLLSDELHTNEKYSRKSLHFILSLPDMPRLLRVGLRLRDNAPVAAYYVGILQEIKDALDEFVFFAIEVHIC